MEKIELYTEFSRILNEVVAFTNKHCIDAIFNVHSIGELRNKSEAQAANWKTFEREAGVYLFIDVSEQNTHYIGMSESDIGGRIYSWLSKESHVNNAAVDEDIVLTINLTEEKYMSRALEAFLIEKLNPVLNKRRIS